jgi:hypothetical protein
VREEEKELVTFPRVMDEIMNKVGTYWLGQRANKEMSSAGDDIEVRETKPPHPCSFFPLSASLVYSCFGSLSLLFASLIQPRFLFQFMFTFCVFTAVFL